MSTVAIVADVNEPGYGFETPEGSYGAPTLDEAMVLARSMGYEPVVDGSSEEFERGRAELVRMLTDEKARQGTCLDCGDEWTEHGEIVVCPECHSTNVCEDIPL